jgi:hypothetical protein
MAWKYDNGGFMEKGFNLKVNDFITSIQQIIGESHLPITVIDSLLQNILIDVDMMKHQQILKEKQEYEKLKVSEQNDDINKKAE